MRGSLTSKIKDAIFAVFGEERLPTINSLATPFKIRKWKSLPSVAKCYRTLFVLDSEGKSYMSRILDKVWADTQNVPKIQIAYAVGVCKTLLNPDNENIQISEPIMKSKVKRNLVNLKFRTF